MVVNQLSRPSNYAEKHGEGSIVRLYHNGCPPPFSLLACDKGSISARKIFSGEFYVIPKVIISNDFGASSVLSYPLNELLIHKNSKTRSRFHRYFARADNRATRTLKT